MGLRDTLLSAIHDTVVELRTEWRSDIHDSIVDLRDTLLSAIHDTVVELRTEWRSDIHDSIVSLLANQLSCDSIKFV